MSRFLPKYQLRNFVPMPPWATPSSYQSNTAAIFRLASSTSQDTRVPQGVTSSQTVKVADGQLAVIALRTGEACLARQYWVKGDKMHCVSESGVEQEFPFANGRPVRNHQTEPRT